jgi:hypothetical protein
MTRPTAIPMATLLVIGMACGPYGFGVLSPDVLTFLEPALPVALGTCGVLFGLAIPRRHVLPVLLLVVAGATALVFVGERSLASSLSLAAQGCGAALVLSAAGWLLLTDNSSETEHRVFMFATLLLIGGAADYTSFSALAGGVVAGLLWQRTAGQAAEMMRSDLRYVEHPLVVLLLLVAGARAEPSVQALLLGLAYLAVNTGARLATGWNPGILGIAIALTAVRAISTDISFALTAIVAGTIGAQLLARLRLPAKVSA